MLKIALSLLVLLTFNGMSFAAETNVVRQTGHRACHRVGGRPVHHNGTTHRHSHGKKPEARPVSESKTANGDKK